MLFRKKKNIPEKPLKEGSEEFDKFIIDLTRERITQEFENVSADEMKGSIIIGACAAIIGIILTVNNYVHFLANPATSLFQAVLKISPLCCIGGAFVCGISLVASREKLKLVKPRETNNDYTDLTNDDLRKTLKKELIENFEFVERNRKWNYIYINAGFLFLMFGVSGIFFTLLEISK